MRAEIGLKEALADLLREQGTTLNDVLDLMDDDKDSVVTSLSKVSNLSEDELSAVEEELSYRQINVLIFALYALYVNNPSGLYRGMILCPARDEIMVGNRVTLEGLKAVARALGIRLRGA